MSKREYPDRVDRDKSPDKTVKNISDDVLKEAVSIATRYGKCPECGEEQFYPVMAGHNTNWDCCECGFEMRIVG